jgi:drug/metabolite transporter (DMT)-like permease
MTRAGTIALTSVTMIAFAANSVLCRLALSRTSIDPSLFTLVRIAAGAVTLATIAAVARREPRFAGAWSGAFALFAYAAAFSFAYLSLPAGAGALILFGSVQATMIVTGLIRGEHLATGQWLGLAVAIAGLVVLVAPGVAAPPLLGAGLMAMAGVAWGAYSIMGRRASDPLAATAGNFLRAAPMALALAIAAASREPPPGLGLLYAVLSGAAASGLGYTIWYAALPGLGAAEAASVQLSVPVIAALGGTLFLAEAISVRLVVSAAAVIGGIALVIASRPGRR